MEVVSPLIEFGEQQHRRENKNYSLQKLEHIHIQYTSGVFSVLMNRNVILKLIT